MGKLLKKEFALCMHPTVPVMLLLSGMVFIPNYPYGVIFFYMTLAIFFTCLTARENHDVIYSLTLPVGKRDIVKARIGYAVILQLCQLLLLIPLSMLRNTLQQAGNQAGMDANIVLLAEGLLLFGLFNLLFFCGYYKDVNKVGVSFVKASVVLFLCITADVVAVYTVPFVRDILDTPDPAFLGYKLAVLAGAAVLYAVLTRVACSVSIRNFEKQDL